MAMASAQTIANNGCILKSGLMEISRKASQRLGDPDLYVKILNFLERVYHESPICKMTSAGNKQVFCSKSRLKEVILTKHILTLESSICKGAFQAIHQEIGDLR